MDFGISQTPWEILWDDTSAIVANDNSTVCEVDVLGSSDPGKAVRDLYMIKAAPVMNEALCTAVEIINEVLAADDMQANIHNGTVFKLSVCKKKMLEAIAYAKDQKM